MVYRHSRLRRVTHPKGAKMLSKKVLIKVFLPVLILVLSGCVPEMATPSPAITQTQTYTKAITITPTLPEGGWEGYLNHTPEPTCPSPTSFSLTDIPPEWLFTPTPDPNIVTISVEIEGDPSQGEITKILFAKWLDHFLGDNISPEMRLIAYTIDQVTIPSPINRSCEQKLGGLFIAETKVTVKTFLPPPVPANRCQTTSRWFIAGGGPVSATETQMTFKFEAVIKRAEDIYTLELIFNTPLCN